MFSAKAYRKKGIFSQVISNNIGDEPFIKVSISI